MQLQQLLKDAKRGASYGVPALAKVLDVYPLTLNRLIRDDLGPKATFRGNRYTIEAADVVAWLENCRPVRIGVVASREAA